MIQFVPYIMWNYEELVFVEKFLMCLPPNIAMLYSLQYIEHLESNGEGLQWSNVWQPIYTDDEMTIGIIMVVFILTSLVLFLLTLYVERLLPDSYGGAEPWYFPFSRAFWFVAAPQIDFSSSENDVLDRTLFEAEPENLVAGIRIRNLSKDFPNGKVAVDNLCINIFRNQITVLLGHDGAGKSTTISMLIGMLQSKCGTACINGYDIRTKKDKARCSIGFCAQNDILFDALTVREHIWFYCKLRGLTTEMAEIEVKKYSDLFDLEPEKRSNALSGSMKRKLSLATAFCGDPDFIICDEPSSGLDSRARRDFWAKLLDKKDSHSILLSTWCIDEADKLGDRIAM